MRVCGLTVIARGSAAVPAVVAVRRTAKASANEVGRRVVPRVSARVDGRACNVIGLILQAGILGDTALSELERALSGTTIA